MTALSQPATSLAASTVLGDIPDAKAQNTLADVVLDPSRPVELRYNSASQLTRSIKRFGPLVSADQEVKLASNAKPETDPQLRSLLASAVSALRSWSHSNRKAALGVRTLGASTVPGAVNSVTNSR